MMWAIFSGDTPFIISEDLKYIEKTCADLNKALPHGFTIAEWIVLD